MFHFPRFIHLPFTYAAESFSMSFSSKSTCPCIFVQAHQRGHGTHKMISFIVPTIHLDTTSVDRFFFHSLFFFDGVIMGWSVIRFFDSSQFTCLKRIKDIQNTLSTFEWLIEGHTTFNTNRHLHNQQIMATTNSSSSEINVVIIGETGTGRNQSLEREV